MNDILNYLQQVVESLHNNLPFLLLLLAIVWLIHLINWSIDFRLGKLGIIPRRLKGLPGILLSPLLHGNFAHLAINSLLFLILGTLAIINGRETFIVISIIIILLSGVLTWLFARRAIHIGASGLIMGYWGYLLINAYHQPTFINIIVGVICIYYFGQLLVNLFPRDKRISWEGHVFGFASGIIASYLLPLFIH